MRTKLFLILLIVSRSLFANPVDTTIAKIVATNFFTARISQSNQARVKSLATQKLEIELVHQEFDDSLDINNKANLEPYYYVYNVKGNNGFIIVSADDGVTPILGYAFEGKYDSINQPPAFIEWMKNFKRQIKDAKVIKQDTINNVSSEWSKIKSSETNQTNATTTEVAPLLTSTWNQGCYYNTYCPQDVNGQCGHVWAGCVAVAMGQIINYWKYPAVCNDIPGYTSPNYGSISGINSTTYNWTNMSNNLTSSSTSIQKDAVAQLLYHCGVSVSMNYGLNGSGAFSINAAIALSRYFNYPASVQYKHKKDYLTTEWKALLTNELDHNRPMYYSGDSIGSHAFVCDGYQNSDYFHFNWGWGGSSDGYFYIDNLNPSGYNLNNNQFAIIGISTVPLPIIQFTNNNLTDGGTNGIGNGNSIAEPGETISFPITLRNSGYAVANNVTAVLSCDDTDISIITNTQSWSTIAVDVSTIASNFIFIVSTSCTDKVIEFKLKINSNESCWTKILKVHVYKKSSVNVSESGSLNSLFTTTQKSTITFLAITGTIDARDFKAIRDNFPTLSAIDLSGSAIVAYTGTEGPSSAYSIVYPANEIPTYAFYNPSTGYEKISLTSIILPLSATSIEYSAFYYCRGLTSITIPSSITSIGSDAFYGCDGLISISVNSRPINLISSTYVFKYVNKSTCILNVPYGTKTLYSSASQWGDFQNIVENTQGFLLSANTAKLAAENGSNVTISITGNVTWNANSDQNWLSASPTSANGNKTITLTAQENHAKIIRTAVITISSTSFASQIINVTQSAAAISVTAGGLSSVLSPTELNQISELALSGSIDARDFKILCDNMPLLANLDLSRVNIVAYTGTEGPYSANSTVYPANEIPTYAFYNPSTGNGKISLTSMILPLSATSIGSYAFLGCRDLTSITIPSSVTSIGSYAFFGCSTITSVTIPTTVTTIGGEAFSYCAKLTGITIQNGNVNYSSNDGVLFNKDQSILLQYPNAKAGSYIIPSSVNTIEYRAFIYCSELTSIIIPSSVTTIRSSAFYRCSKITSITIPSSVTIIGSGAFADCTNLTEIIVKSDNNYFTSTDGVLFNKNQSTLIQCLRTKTGSYVIPSSVNSIEDDAFHNCDHLFNITIPSTVNKIGRQAFVGCDIMTNIIIPSSVTSIGSYAFIYCSGLKSIYTYSITPIDLTSSTGVFISVNKTTCTLYVPPGSEAAYQAANQWKDFTNIIEMTTAVPDIDNENINLYPNPAGDKFYIKGFEGIIDFSLYDINGVKLMTDQARNSNSISISTLPKGLYLVKITKDKVTYDRKLLKK